MKNILIKIFIVMISGLLASGPVIAEEELLSAGELLESCEEGSSPGAPNQYCMRYVFGLVQMTMSLQQAEQSPPIFCINPQVTRLETATDTVMAYLRSQKSRANEDAQQLVLEALNKNYPCSAGNQT